MPPKRKQTTKRTTKRSPRKNPAPAYAGERTFTAKYQSVYKLNASASGGFIEPVNLSLCDQLSTVQATWAMWMLKSFTIRATPASNAQGAYAICPYESLAGAIPVTPTNLIAVLDGGGKLKACTNSASNISRLRYRKKIVNEALFTPTTTINATGGDPGFSFFLELDGSAVPLGALFYVEVDAWFEFREPTQFTTRQRSERIMVLKEAFDDEDGYDTVSTTSTIAALQRDIASLRMASKSTLVPQRVPVRTTLN
jgi:hypothetical protein